jgi:hypothetical protein
MNFMNRKMFQAGGASDTLGSYEVFDRETGKTTKINPGFLKDITLKSQIAYPLLNGYKSGQLLLGEGILQELDTYRLSDEPFGITGDLSSQARIDDLGTAAFDLSRGVLRGAEGPLRGIAGFVGEFGGIDRLKDISSFDFRTGTKKEFEPLIPTREENRSQILEELISKELATQTPIIDFQEDIDQIKEPIPVPVEEDQTSFDFRDEDMASKVGQAEFDTNVARIEQEIKDDPISQTLGIADFDIDARRKAFEEAIEGRDEFGELIPTDRPPTPSMPPENLSGLDEIDVLVEDIMPTDALAQNKFGVDDIKPSLLKVDTSITDADLKSFNEAELPDAPKETTGIFGSDRFLDFVRNVGAGLVSTGQIGEGLAVGAAKAAEERTARELLESQERKKFEDAKRLLEIEANLAGKEPPSISDLDKIKTNEEELNQSLRDFKKGENTLSNLNTVIKILETEDATGIKGFFGEATDMIESAIKSDTGKKFEDLEPRTRANALLKVLRQANVREILGESGRTISNLDRTIVEDVFGDIKLGTPRAVSLKKLKDSRKNIIGNLEQSRDQITSAKTFFDLAQFNSPVYMKNYDLINLINNFDFDNAMDYIKDATASSVGIPTIDL